MIDKIKKLFVSDLDHIENIENGVNVFLKNGEKIAMYDSPQETNIDMPRCNFCGEPSLGDISLFGDTNNFICQHCASEAINAFLRNGVTIDIKLDQNFEDCIENLKKL